MPRHRYSTTNMSQTTKQPSNDDLVANLASNAKTTEDNTSTAAVSGVLMEPSTEDATTIRKAIKLEGRPAFDSAAVFQTKFDSPSSDYSGG